VLSVLSRTGSAGHLFRPVRLGAPFLLQTAIPIVLRHLPPYGTGASALPFNGRRLLSFTDSRQGTARFAAKMQLETERDFVRSLLYHSVADRARPTDRHEQEDLRHEITKLEQAIKAHTLRWKPCLPRPLLKNARSSRQARLPLSAG